MGERCISEVVGSSSTGEKSGKSKKVSAGREGVCCSQGCMYMRMYSETSLIQPPQDQEKLVALERDGRNGQVHSSMCVTSVQRLGLERLHCTGTCTCQCNLWRLGLQRLHPTGTRTYMSVY